MSGRFETLILAIDAANSADPTRNGDLPAALVYGQRMTEVLTGFAPDASECLQIAARAQHIERWIIPRQSYPEGRTGYLTWRKALQQHHARRAGELMAAHAYDEKAISRVGSLLRKERLKFDPEVQTLEDVICLVFLQYEAPAFIAKHEASKVRDILAKTATKMSARGVQAAADLTLEHRLKRLLSEALTVT
jgi:hypothetical protein